MRIYFLVEGEQTEMKLYPSWLSFLIPELSQVDSFKSIKDNSYFLFCGHGIPSIYNHTINAIKDINTRTDYDYLIICLDGDNISVEQRKNKLYKHLEDNKIELIGKCKLKIVVHNCCIETWFIGNRKIIKANPAGETLKEYIAHYDVKAKDPELMVIKKPFVLNSQFHESYLREIFKEHDLCYRKARPKEVLHKTYFAEIKKRIDELPNDLKSFQEFLAIVEEIKSGLKQ